MRTVTLALVLALVAGAAGAAETAGLAGMVQTNGTVDVNGFRSPRDIWTVYTPNKPDRQAVILAYVAYKVPGTHQITISWYDQTGAEVDFCRFDPIEVPELPWIQTLSCQYGGRLPRGGLTFKVINHHEGSRETIGELFIPSL